MELFDYQRKFIDKASEHLSSGGKQFNLFLQMGLGKTIIAIEITKALKYNTILIVCPKSLIDMWIYNIGKYLPGYARMDKPEELNDCSWKAFSVVNYEYFRRSGEHTVITPECCIFDEVHKIKNVNSLTHKRISADIVPKHVLNLTGTPITKDYMDLFGILTATGKQTFFGYTAAQFKVRYIVNGGNARTQELMKLIEPYSVFGDIEEYIDMPGAQDVIIPIQLSLEQQAELSIICKSNESALARITKAQMITSGITDETYNAKRIACVQLVRDILADGEKVVIFTKYDKEFDFFMQFFGSEAVGINGKTDDRNTPVIEFQNNPKCKIFIGNLQTASAGITLTQAHKCIFYSETHTWGDADQARARIYRIGQDSKCIYYHLLALGTIDEIIYNSNLYKTDLIEDFKKRYGGN